MCKTIKITGKDNFVWRLLTVDQAKEIFTFDIESVYALYDDDSEALVMDFEEFDELAPRGVQFGIEVGFANYREVEKLDKALSNHDFTYQYSDDHRVYKAGHESLQRIVELRDFVSSDDFIRLWNKYSPKDLRIKC